MNGCDIPAIDVKADRIVRADCALILLVAALMFAGLRSRVVDMPLERDEGGYAYFAQNMLKGAVPYRDIMDNKPPGVFLTYLAPVAVAGTSVVAIHLWLYLWQAATAVFVYLVARRAFGSRPACVSVLAYSFLSVEPRWLGSEANTEPFMVLPLTISIWCAQRAAVYDRRVWWVAGGAAAMAAVWFKQVAAFNVAFLAAFAVAWTGKRGGRPPAKLLGDAIAFIIGALAVAFPVVTYLAANGALDDFAEATRIAARHAELMTLGDGWGCLKREWRNQVGSLWLIWLLGLSALLDWRRPVRGRTLFVLGALAAAAAGVSVGLHFRAHYFIQLGPPLAWAAGVALDRLAACVARSRPVVILSAIAVTLPSLIYHRAFWLAPDTNARARMMYEGNPFPESADIARFLAQRTTPDDRIFIYGSEPQILFLAERRFATRYIFAYALTMDLVDGPRRQKESWEQISQAPPKVIIMTELASSVEEKPGMTPYLRTRLEGLIKRSYRLQGLRTVENGKPRLIFGDDAQRYYDAARRRKPRPYMDMLIYENAGSFRSLLIGR